MRHQNSGAIGALEMLQDILGRVLWLAAAALLLVTGYYVYATIAGSDQLFRGLTADGQAVSVREFQRHLGNMELLTRVLLVAGIVTIVAALGRYYAHAETGLVLLLAGAALFFGMPLFLDTMGGSGQLAPALARLGNPRLFLAGQYRVVGAAFLGAGVLDLLVHALVVFGAARSRRPKANEEAARTAAQVRRPQDRFLGPCWSLPFCRDTEKKLCPIRATRKPCWRTGRGCYCDQNVILALSGGNSYAASRGPSGYLSAAAAIARPKTLREKREQCLQCPVYLHHQGQKHQVLAPLALLAAAGTLWYYWGPMKAAYPKAMLSLGRALSTFSVKGTTGDPAWVRDLAFNEGIMWMLLAVAVALAIAYAMQGVEWVLYRLGL